MSTALRRRTPFSKRTLDEFEMLLRRAHRIMDERGYPPVQPEPIVLDNRRFADKGSN